MAVFVADEQSCPVDLDRLRRLAAFVAEAQRVPVSMEVSVLCVDRESMATLNGQHMDSRGPTDVLAFPVDLPGESLPDEPAILGDVVICPEVAIDQAAEHGNSAEAELDLLVVHGMLHLLGHDHADERERAAMFALTDDLLQDFSARGHVPPRPRGHQGP